MSSTSADFESFGPLLRTFRKRLRLTQQQLAQAVGMHRHTVSRWEQGEVLPSGKAVVLELARKLHLDPQETRRLLDASLASPVPIWGVPLPRNPFFTGRETVLHLLEQSLCRESERSHVQVIALTGLGGVGKTHVALEYAYRHALEYDAVFWIAAETAESIQVSIQSIADLVHLPERAEADQQRVVKGVQRWLATHTQWLLIWDNVEEVELPFSLLPQTAHGTMLLTTRHHALGTLARSIPLAPLEQEDSLLFLLRRARLVAGEDTGEQVHQWMCARSHEHAASATLVDLLGGLPLALDQAGAYIEETGCTFSDYLRQYQRHHAFFLQRRGGLGVHHPQPVTTTLQLSLERVQQQNSKAAALLRACAFLHADAIPEELFTDGAAQWGPALDPIGGDPLQFDLAVAVLRDLSLVQRNAETHMLSLHRLVQVVTRDLLGPGEVRVWSERVIRAVNAVFPDGDYASWGQCERLIAQAMACQPLIGAMGAEVPEAVELLQKTGNYLLGRGQFDEAQRLATQAMDLGEHLFGVEHPALILPLELAAELADHFEDYASAEALAVRKLALEERFLESPCFQIGDTLNTLAVINFYQGKCDQAEILYVRAIEMEEQALGTDHPDLAIAINNLAALYREQGKFGQAEPLYRRALWLRQQPSVAKPSDIAFSLTGLATLYHKQGQLDQAEPLLREALAIRQQVLGPEHPDVVFSLRQLSHLYQEQGKNEQAKHLLLQALQIQQHTVGADHPDTVILLEALANLLNETSIEKHAAKEEAMNLR